MFPVWFACEPLLTGFTRGSAFRDMIPDAEWAELGRKWAKIPREERLAMHPRFQLPIRAEMMAYQEKRERKNKAQEAARMGRLESEAWAEHAERERAEKLARAIRKIRRRV